MSCVLYSLPWLWGLWHVPYRPNRLPPPRVKDAPPPAATLILCGPTNWGEFSQVGRYVYLAGDPIWSAAGSIQSDGRVQIEWVTNDGRSGLSVYTIQRDGTFVGQWGWKEDCEILGNGNLVGNVMPDMIRRVAAPPKAVEEPPIN